MPNITVPPGRALQAALAMTLALAGPAQAAAIVDFTARAWSGANGQNSYTVGNATLQAFYTGAGTPTLTFNAGAAAGCASAGSDLACDGDGIGINSRLLFQDPGEVDAGLINREGLRLSFSNPVALMGFDVLNLFLLETGEYRLDNGSWLSFGSPGIVPGGYASISLGGSAISTIDFRAANSISDFSLASVRVAVPEPTSLLLLGVALAGAGVARRRRS
jgi:hypothetical protein